MGEQKCVALGNMSLRKFFMPQYTEFFDLGQCPGAQSGQTAQEITEFGFLAAVYMAFSFPRSQTV
jgi:hypothetical protein